VLPPPASHRENWTIQVLMYGDSKGDTCVGAGHHMLLHNKHTICSHPTKRVTKD
jgi:hypothetical protein